MHSGSTMKPESGWFQTPANPPKLGAVQWDNLKCKCDILLGKLTRHDCRLSLLLQSHSESHSSSLFSSNAVTIDNHQEPASNKYQITPLPHPEVTYALNYLLFILHKPCCSKHCITGRSWAAVPSLPSPRPRFLACLHRILGRRCIVPA